MAAAASTADSTVRADPLRQEQQAQPTPRAQQAQPGRASMHWHRIKLLAGLLNPAGFKYFVASAAS